MLSLLLLPLLLFLHPLTKPCLIPFLLCHVDLPLLLLDLLHVPVLFLLLLLQLQRLEAIFHPLISLHSSLAIAVTRSFALVMSSLSTSVDQLQMSPSIGLLLAICSISYSPTASLLMIPLLVSSCGIQQRDQGKIVSEVQHSFSEWSPKRKVMVAHNLTRLFWPWMISLTLLNTCMNCTVDSLALASWCVGPFCCSLAESLLPMVMSSKIPWISVKDCFAGESFLVCKCSLWIRPFERRISVYLAHSRDEIKLKVSSSPIICCSLSLSNVCAVFFSLSVHQITPGGDSIKLKMDQRSYELLTHIDQLSLDDFDANFNSLESTVIGLCVGTNGDPQLANKLVNFKTRVTQEVARRAAANQNYDAQLNQARTHKNAEEARLIVQSIVKKYYQGTELTTFNKIDKLITLANGVRGQFVLSELRLNTNQLARARDVEAMEGTRRIIHFLVTPSFISSPSAVKSFCSGKELPSLDDVEEVGRKVECSVRFVFLACMFVHSLTFLCLCPLLLHSHSVSTSILFASWFEATRRALHFWRGFRKM